MNDTPDPHRFLLDIKTRVGTIIGKHTCIATIEERMRNLPRGLP